MSQSDKGQLETQISCPFCKKSIVDTWEVPESPCDDDYDNEGDHEITSVSSCPHVAYSGNWGYEDFASVDPWKSVIKSLTKVLEMEFNQVRCYDDISLDDTDGYDDDILAEIVRENTDKLDDIERIMRRAQPDLDIACREFEMDTGDGPHGNGVAWYFYVFLRSKDRKATSPRPSRKRVKST